MNENLKKLLSSMLYLTDEQPLGEEIDKIDFTKDGWYKKFHWTERNEEKATELISDLLKKDWKGVAKYKPTNKRMRDRIADEFIGNYGAITRPLTPDDFTSVVSWSQLDEVMSKQEREAFDKWMFGQTTPLYGVYRYDLERWLNHLPNLD